MCLLQLSLHLPAHSLLRSLHRATRQLVSTQAAPDRSEPNVLRYVSDMHLSSQAQQKQPRSPSHPKASTSSGSTRPQPLPFPLSAPAPAPSRTWASVIMGKSTSTSSNSFAALETAEALIVDTATSSQPRSAEGGQEAADDRQASWAKPHCIAPCILKEHTDVLLLPHEFHNTVAVSSSK